MKSSQWYIIGIFLILMSSWFIMVDVKWDCLKLDEISQPIDRLDLFECINSEILDPFIWLLFPLGWIFIVCGWIESRSKKKGAKASISRTMYDAKEKDFAMKVAQKLKLKHLPQDISELVYWGKKEGKEKDVDKAIKEKTERWLLSLELFKEKNKRYKPKDMDKDWIAKMKKKYPDEKPYEFTDYEV